jgi:hypothetical protein
VAGDGGAGGDAQEINREYAQWPMPNPPSTGLPNPQSYGTNDPDVIVDRLTALMWERSLTLPFVTFDEAPSRCDALTLGGFDDWRAPTLIELLSIVDWTRQTPAVASGVFLGIEDVTGLAWSATPLGSQGLAVDFLFAHISRYSNSSALVVRCVRAGATPKNAGYVLEAETLENTATGLTWERHASTTTGSPISGAAYCDELVLGGHSDWRLPSAGELATLVDPTVQAPFLSRQAFPDEEGRIDQVYWGFEGWSFDFGYLAMNAGSAALHRTRCVR